MIRQMARVGQFAVVLSFVCHFTTVEGLFGQIVAVEKEENIRASENGILLGRMTEGSELELLTSRDNWLQVNLEGWVWEESLQAVDTEGFDLTVSASEGENIRNKPQGLIVGRLENGTLLKSVERVSGWIRVERKVWIWSESVDVQTMNMESEADSTKAGKIETEWLTLGKGLAVLDGPNGDTLVRPQQPSRFEVLARQGNWAQISINGWLWAPETSEDMERLPVLVDVNIDDVSGRSDEFEGRFLQWDLQFVTIEKADRIRSDFYENENFLVTRLANTEDNFIYVAVSPEFFEEVSFLNPMDEVRVVGRLRTASEKLTNAPILELISLERKIP